MLEAWMRPDGSAVAVNTAFGVIEWLIDPDFLADAACELAGRNLTETEWATHFPDEPYRKTC